ncbi:hypothetical protein BBJ28_00022569 [Nothophytophthora sp. Chile5]|nr:hypothetical protein BBJ28_00022569 [Nothophytophthora sp. Chile5]
MDFALARLPSKEVRDLMSSLEGIIPSPIGSGSHTWSVARPSPESASQHESQTVNEVELTFGDGPLGITFESTHLRLLAASNFEPERQLGGSAVVKALPRLQNGLAGPAERSGLISAGSFLIGINREPTLDLTFEETIDYLRRAKRPIRLRFLNARLPYENACQFAERLQALSLVSALQTEHENLLLPWVDSLRGAFAAMFAGIFRDYQKYIGVERRESNATDGLGQQHVLPKPENYGRMRRQSSALAFAVQFDHQAFCHSMQATDKHRFLREFTQTQSFAGFINESIMGRPMARPRGAYPPLELFKECMHLVRESSDARGAIALLFKRNGSPAESMALDLPMTLAEANDEVAVEAIVGLREDFGYYSASGEEEGAESSTNLTSIGVLPVTEPAGTVDLAPTESPSSSSPSSPLAEKADARNVLEVTTKQPGLASPEQEEGDGSGVVEATLEADP